MFKALLVDDERRVRQGFTKITDWAAHGIRIVGEAKDGSSALAYLAKQPVDLLFVDISMPGMNGFELIKRVRDKYPEIRSVILTCHHEFDYVQEALRLGAIDYIVKTLIGPDNADESIRRIASRLAREGHSSAHWFYGSTPTRSGDGIHPEPRIDEAIADWSQGRWLLYGNDWNRFVSQVERMRPHPDQLVPLLRSFLDNELACMQMQRQDEEPHTWEDWRNRLTQDVLQVQQKLTESALSREVARSLFRAMRYMRENIGEGPTQEAVARHVGMSRSYFSQCYKRFTGCTFADSLKDMQIERAKTLLRETDLSVYDIASRSGFEDNKYFSRVFREHTGLLPSEYRAEAAQDRKGWV